MGLFDYPKWGLAETNEAKNVTAVKELSEEQYQQGVKVLTPFVDLKNYELKKAALVEHYQGKMVKPAQLALLRFEREDGKNNGLGGEHISVTIDLESNQLMGFTRMCSDLIGDTFVTHQQALNTAIGFLKKAAPDLMSKNAVPMELTASTLGSEMDFSPVLNIGNIEVHWINSHKEDIKADDKDVEVYGMKVKMYIPSNELWTWVIIDKQGNVETFERNIFWNFTKFKRETQMWLHDKWLEAHNIELPEIEFIPNNNNNFQ